MMNADNSCLQVQLERRAHDLLTSLQGMSFIKTKDNLEKCISHFERFKILLDKRVESSSSIYLNKLEEQYNHLDQELGQASFEKSYFIIQSILDRAYD